MAEETKKGQWRECEIAGVKHLVWVPPPGSLTEGQPFPFCAFPADEAEAVKKKWPLGPTEDELWRQDYEAARKFAYHAHMLLYIGKTFAEMLAICGKTMPEKASEALFALQHLCNNVCALTDLKIKKQPHRDTVFISPTPNDKEQENV